MNWKVYWLYLKITKKNNKQKKTKLYFTKLKKWKKSLNTEWKKIEKKIFNMINKLKKLFII